MENIQVHEVPPAKPKYILVGGHPSTDAGIERAEAVYDIDDGFLYAPLSTLEEREGKRREPVSRIRELLENSGRTVEGELVNDEIYEETREKVKNEAWAYSRASNRLF